MTSQIDAQRVTLPRCVRLTDMGAFANVARLLNRVGRRLCQLHGLHIEYPVGRGGSRFECSALRSDLEGIDTSVLRFFLIQDDAGNRYPATIDPFTPSGDGERVLLRGVVVCAR